MNLTDRQINLALEVLVLGALISGLASWALPDRTNGWAIVVHAVSGLGLLALTPAKLRGPARKGMRRSGRVRWVSVGFGVVVLATLATGLAHALGLATGVGYWSPLWTHQLLGFVAVPLFAFHLVTRPVRFARRDLDRRALLRYAGVAAVAGGLHLAHRPLRALVDPSARRSTGSYEVASGDPERMPAVVWLDDERPASTTAEDWTLTMQGRVVAIDDLWDLSRPVDAALDCTGGWWSEQRWDAVPLADLVPDPTGRSLRVTSATGYARWVGLDQIDRAFLAVGYGGRPLRPGHGAPVRLIVPGRRGPEWVKWVVDVSDDNRPSWLAAPLPPT